MIEGFEFQKWVKKSLNRRMILNFVGAAGCLLAALVVCWLTWWTVYFITWFVLLTLEPPALAVFGITWAVFALLFVAYYLGNREVVERLEFESPAKLRAARAAALLTNSPFLALAGPKTAGSFVRVIAAIALVGPGMLATSWRLLVQANAARRASPEHVGAVLATLAHAGTRVSLDELFRLDASDRWDATFGAVRLFDGVIVRSSEPVGLVMSDSLRNEVLKTAPAEVKRPQAAKSPPVRVSSKGQPGGGSIVPKRGGVPKAPKPGGAPAAQKPSPPAAAPKPRPKPRPKPPE